MIFNRILSKLASVKEFRGRPEHTQEVEFRKQSDEFFKRKEFVVLFQSIIFTICFNSSVLSQRFNDYKVAGLTKAINLLIFEVFMAIMLTYPIIYALSGRQKILKSLLVFIYLISGLAAYFVYNFNLIITPEIIATFFESSLYEISNFISLKLILVLVSSIALALFCIYTLKHSIIDRIKDKRLTFITVIFTLGCIFGDGDWAINIMPCNVVKQTSTYIFEKTALMKPRLNLAQNFKYEISTKNDDLNVILILGESGRRDHFSLGGYNRNTSPLMENEPNLIYYSDVTACFPLTRVAVPCMLTRATREDMTAASTETSFIGIFRSLGFYTSWFGMQGTYTVIDAPYFDLAKEAHKSLLMGVDVDVFTNLDEKLYPFVDNFFLEHPSGNNLLILHTIGSHFHYEDRYTEEFRKFTPICTKKKFLTDMTHCTIEERINSYDNSILYTDNFIKSIIDRVRNKNAIVIFTPDHGESLGEHGRFLHGTHNADEQIAVNMLIWTSDKFMQKYPDIIESLRQKKEQKILHDHLFHSILGCSGIKSDVIDSKLNLCE